MEPYRRLALDAVGRTTSGVHHEHEPFRSSGTGGEIDRDETFNLIASDKVEGTDVRRPNGDKIGAIYRLMIDKRSGRVAYAVMSFGGFLGLGESRRPIPWEALRYNEDLDAYELDIGEDQLRSAPSTRTARPLTGPTPTGTEACGRITRSQVQAIRCDAGVDRAIARFTHQRE